VKASKSGRKGPPKNFATVREAREALTHLADSLTTHSFTWPAAAIRSYLSGGSESLDTAFGLAEWAAAAKSKAKTGASGAASKAAPGKHKKPSAPMKRRKRL
jgi:hypothetical protein